VIRPLPHEGLERCPLPQRPCPDVARADLALGRGAADVTVLRVVVALALRDGAEFLDLGGHGPILPRHGEADHHDHQEDDGGNPQQVRGKTNAEEEQGNQQQDEQDHAPILDPARHPHGIPLVMEPGPCPLIEVNNLVARSGETNHETELLP
jgi:hypothetical protein